MECVGKGEVVGKYNVFVLIDRGVVGRKIYADDSKTKREGRSFGEREG